MLSLFISPNYLLFFTSLNNKTLGFTYFQSAYLLNFFFIFEFYEISISKLFWPIKIFEKYFRFGENLSGKKIEMCLDLISANCCTKINLIYKRKI